MRYEEIDLKENTMFEVTKEASQKVKEFFQGRKELSPIRIVAGSGCCGPSLGMALDEAKEDDEVFEVNGITYVIDRQLLELAKPICVDFAQTDTGTGFSITSSLTADISCESPCC